MDKDKYILITGASGFIGSGIIKYLNDLGYENLILIDDLNDDKWKNLVSKKFLDIINIEDAFSFLRANRKKISSIIHMGACSDTTCSDANYLLENNYRFTKDLAIFSIQNNIRFIYASSAATYGDGKNGFDDDIENLDNLKPINMYAYSKHLFDLFAKRENLFDKIVGLKYFNVFGPNEYHKKHMSSMIYKMHNIANTGEVIKLFKSNDLKKFDHGEQKRDFIYVKDAVNFTCKFLFSPYDKAAGLFNVGSGLASSWNEMAKYLFLALKKDANIKYIDMPNTLSDQYQNYTKASTTKLKNIFKDEFKITSMKDSINDYVNNYLLEGEMW
ncbi:MAG: ADP-L-glycero-D-manno-heptose-6-epimerase [Candidatus Anoxychlamydiales bacterium]|nr:ADP-L-glycero-D-manno-heptose-6-epimerase [Candidatus Anoxychlamydiales bacterium]